MPDRLRRPWPALLVASGLLAAMLGIALHPLWRVLPWERFALSLLLALLAALLAWPLRRFACWSMASALLLAWMVPLLYFAGPAAVLSTSLLAAAALAVGLRLVPPMPGQGALALVTGLAVIAGVTGWIVMLPVHHPLVWGALLLALAWSQRARLLPGGRALQQAWRSEVATAPSWAAFAVMLLGLASTACWLPTMQVDDLAYHLGLPSQWLQQLRYAPAPQHQVWAFAPWAGDVLHGITSVLSRGEARGALNALWLVLAAASAWGATARLSAAPRERWACVALFASFPPLVWLAAGMQTELPAMAMLLALAAVLLPGPDTDAPGDRRVYTASVLLGGLLALKLTHALAALPLLAYAGWQYRPSRYGAAWPWRRLAAGLAIVAVIGGSSYCYAWLYTGNPLLPLFNTTFASPFYPARDFDDPRWHAGFGPTLPWDLVFDTARYLEAWAGGLGIGLVALAGAWLVALLRADTRAFALAAALAILLPLVPLQYARYAFPGMALLLVVLLPRLEAGIGRRFFGWAIIATCVVNLAFQANAGWTHHSSALKHTLRSGGDAAAVFAHYVPERVLIATIPANDRSIVLATSPARGYIAELGGHGRTVSSHDPALEAARIAADADPTGARWRALFATTRARWILMTPATSSPALRKAVFDASGMRSAQSGDAQLWRLPAAEDAAP
jgi:hypothetical protein